MSETKTVRIVRIIRCAGDRPDGQLCNKFLTKLVFEITSNEEFDKFIGNVKVFSETKCNRCKSIHCSLSIV